MGSQDRASETETMGSRERDCGHGRPGPSQRDWWVDGRETRQDATTSSDARTPAPTSGTDPSTRELRERLRFLEDAFEKGAEGHRGHRMDHLSITVAHDVRRKIVEGKSIDLAILLAKSFMDRQEDRQTVAYVLEFRIGAATTAVISGRTMEEKKILGRWKSQAVRVYIRV
ncbi:hypothetical protein V1264_013694 [Littorina saxatilis]|uniref:Uncharacterized protein n=1 Tax=Littorina saxatilis TaxID=31220 RepID=A0AAN9G0C8_9CAEN